MTIWERVKTALTGLGLPMAANTYIGTSGGDLPAEYLVYQLISDPPIQHADDAEKMVQYRVQVTAYSRISIAPLRASVTTAMAASGFMRLPSREIPYHPTTRHYGLAMDFSFVEEV